MTSDSPEERRTVPWPGAAPHASPSSVADERFERRSATGRYHHGSFAGRTGPITALLSSLEALHAARCPYFSVPPLGDGQHVP
ncbi:MAG TPA: hypothetical protein VHN80_11165, partial [Kineosporiaceae bacterium]|nr:hypothetical protein [Kineosporiaceae bacterium]